jgi:hypothetical protein
MPIKAVMTNKWPPEGGHLFVSEDELEAMRAARLPPSY